VRGAAGEAHLGPREVNGDVDAVAVAAPRLLALLRSEANTVARTRTPRRRRAPSGGTRRLLYLDKAKRGNAGSGRCGVTREELRAGLDRERGSPPSSGQRGAPVALCSNRAERTSQGKRAGLRRGGSGSEGERWCG
jgi:hypothetical protein